MDHTKIVKPIAVILISALTISSADIARASTDPVAELRQSVITRTPDNTDDALIHYTFTDSQGNPYEIQADTSAGGDDRSYGSQEDFTTDLPMTPYASTPKKAAHIPDAYDLRTENIITPIKDQGYSGACWAFGAMKALESNAIRKGLVTSDVADFSESHLTWFAFHPSNKSNDKMMIDGFYPISNRTDAAYLWGGSSLLTIFTLAKWSGIVTEDTAPFQSDSTEQQINMAKMMADNEDSLRYQSSYHLQNATCYDIAPTDEWKKALMQTSALALGLYYNPIYLSTGHAGTTYYQTSYRGSAAIKAANHCVAVVGWDDNYSRMNFPEHLRPSGNGAWLIANSYGTNIGDSGYFWLSYEEPSICDIYSFDVEKVTNYSNNYQYDGFGWGSAIPGTSNQKGGNIFRTRNDYNQNLEAVGIYTITDNQSYTIQIYKNPENGNPASGTLVSASTTSGTIAYNGFHTITLKKPVALSANQRFSVVVTYKTSGNGEVYLPIEGSGQTTSTTQSLYDSNQGQSFYYSETGKTWLDTSLAGQNNICIKAYAVNTKKVPVVHFTKSSASLGVGEKLQISYTYKNLQKKQITWKSSRKNIASVSSSGKVKAKKRGTTTITAIGSTAKASMKIQVKKAPSSITATVKKKVLKREKKYRIKTKLSPGSASYSMKYTSSKPKVASVSEKGVVTAHKKGKTTIRIRTFNKKTAKVTIQVK